MKFRNWFILGSVLVISLSIGLAYLLDQNPIQNIPTGTQEFKKPALQVPRYQLEKKSIKKETPHYEIDVEYPELVIEDSVLAKTFNTEIQRFINNYIDTFTKEFENNPLHSPEEAISGVRIWYEVSGFPDAIIGVLFEGSPYYAGAAHPGQEYGARNFNLKSGLFFEIQDLFQKNRDYISALSQRCKSDLLRQVRERTFASEKEIIQAGCGAGIENFQNFTITQDAIVIHFAVYQVGPYAAGPVTVNIPYTDIQSLLDPNGSLGFLFNTRKFET